MPPRPSRLERITNLVLALLETERPLSLREIGSSVAGYPSEKGALRQAFERDKRTLRDDGIPLSVERIDGDDQVGYRILPQEYYLPDLGLSPEETEALVFALAMVRLEGGSNEDVSQKLGQAGAPTLPPLAVLPSLPALGPLHHAIKIRALSRFTYRGSVRLVEGYGLIFREGSWYFVGRDRSVRSGASLRSFRVDRIEGGVELDDSETYEIPSQLQVGRELRVAPFETVAPGADGDHRAIEVTIELDRRELGGVRSVIGPDVAATPLGVRSVLLRFRVADEEAFVTWALGFGDALIVREPAHLRTSVRRRLAGLARDHVDQGSSA